MGIIALVKPVRSAVELEFIGNEIAEPVHPLSRAFLDLWHSKHHGAALPSRDEFSMSELRYFLPHLLIAEPVKAYRDFFYRFAGSQLEERVGFHLQGSHRATRL
ncbi:MAG: PAS domain-containing protein [Alphaproteobacteria bacterium]|nr:PAS domain-containing protein [Alphaproteobacteria bacterium]